MSQAEDEPCVFGTIGSRTKSNGVCPILATDQILFNSEGTIRADLTTQFKFNSPPSPQQRHGKGHLLISIFVLSPPLFPFSSPSNNLNFRPIRRRRSRRRRRRTELPRTLALMLAPPPPPPRRRPPLPSRSRRGNPPAHPVEAEASARSALAPTSSPCSHRSRWPSSRRPSS